MSNRMLLALVAVVLTALGAAPGASAAEPRLKVVGIQIPALVEGPDQGAFVLLTKEVARRAGVDIEIEVQPGARATEAFLKGEFQVYFPGADTVLGNADVAKSEPMYIKRDFVFYRADAAPIRSLEDLNGKRIGLTSNYQYDAAITDHKGATFDRAYSDVENMKKLSLGRIDGFVVEEKSGQGALAAAGVANVTYDPSTPIVQQPTYYTFANTQEGRMLAEKFSRALQEVIADGTYAKILGQPKP